MRTNLYKPEVDEKLWFATNRLTTNYINDREVTVEKVGSKYFYADGMRFEIDTWCESDERGFSSCGACFRTKEEWEKNIRATEYRGKICNMLNLLSDEETIELFEKLNERKRQAEE